MAVRGFPYQLMNKDKIRSAKYSNWILRRAALPCPRTQKLKNDKECSVTIAHA